MVGIFLYTTWKKAIDLEIKGRALFVAGHLSELAVDDIIAQDAYEIYKKIIPVFTSRESSPIHRDLLYIVVYNRNGELIVGRTTDAVVTMDARGSPATSSPPGTPPLRGPLEKGETGNTPVFVWGEDGNHDLTYPVVIAGDVVGFLRLGMSGNIGERIFPIFARHGAIAFIAVLLLALLFSQIIAIGITRPISQLTSAIEELERQNWKSPLPIKGRDEIARLARSFNQMAITLRQRDSSLSQGNRDLFMLHAAGIDLMESLEIEQLIRKISVRAEDLVRADTIALSLLTPQEKTLKYMGVHGGKAEALKGLDQPLETGGLFNWLVSYGTPLLISDAEKDFRLDTELVGRLGIKCLMTVPLWASNAMIGMLTAYNKKGGTCFDRHDLRLFTVFSNMAGSALQNARLFRDLKKSMDELRHAQEQLIRSTKMAAIGEIAANVAHEINNPLTSVLGYASHLKRTLDLPEQPKNLLNIIEQETIRVRKIIRNLLDFARPRPSRLQPSDLRQPLRETLALLSGIAEESSVRIHEEYDGVPVIVNMDPGEIKQVFINIVNNALQAMPNGGDLKIGLKIGQDGEAIIEFADTGHGIPQENIDKIFEPFFSTRTEAGGTGLGLSISKRIVQNHGGRIEVESTLGKGSVFRVYLPVHRTDRVGGYERG